MKVISNLIENPFEILKANYSDSPKEILVKTRTAMISREYSMAKLANAQKELLDKDLKRASALLFDEVPVSSKSKHTKRGETINFKKDLFRESDLQEFITLAKEWTHF